MVDPELLQRLGFHEDDARELLRAPRPPEAVALADSLVAGMGRVDAPPPPWRFDPARPWDGVWPLLGALPHVRAHHASRRVPDEVSWTTLSDLGRNAAIFRRVHGSGGFDHAWWLTLHFRGLIYELGRLQFERIAEPWLCVHIPESGPLDPGSCDASFAAACAFFARRFPEEPRAGFVCTSWLLDPQLAEYLPTDSNIVRFQRRFSLDEATRDGNDDVLLFVFRRPGARVDELPQRTALERAVVAHLRAGRSWRVRTGRIAIGSQA